MSKLSLNPGLLNLYPKLRDFDKFKLWYTGKSQKDGKDFSKIDPDVEGWFKKLGGQLKKK